MTSEKGRQTQIQEKRAQLIHHLRAPLLVYSDFCIQNSFKVTAFDGLKSQTTPARTWLLPIFSQCPLRMPVSQTTIATTKYLEKTLSTSTRNGLRMSVIIWQDWLQVIIAKGQKTWTKEFKFRNLILKRKGEDIEMTV